MFFYDRVGEITLGRPGAVGKVYTGLNFSFDFKKTITPEVNPGTLRIYNLAPDTRRSIHELETVCIVKVGYAEAEGPIEVFRGYVTVASSPREGANLVTTLELRDGYQELKAAEFAGSYAEGTDLNKIISDVIKKIKLPFVSENMKKRLEKKVKEKSGDLLRGWSFNGTAKDAMDELAAFAGVSWSIQSGRLKMLAEKETDQKFAVVISPTNGLIGRPTRISDIDTEVARADEKKKKVMGWRLESLLQPSIEPGNAVSVESNEVTGTFKVMNVQHTGELMGQEWKTMLEVMEI